MQVEVRPALAVPEVWKMPKVAPLFKTTKVNMDLVIVKPFPDLPSDVARYLLEASAWKDPCAARALTRVSRIVRQWIDPILYHTVVLHDVSQLVQFHRSIALRNDSAFFARRVKLLRLGNLTDAGFGAIAPVNVPPFERQMELVQTVLNTCSGVRRFAFWLNLSKRQVLHAFTGISRSSHLTHLSVLDVMPDSSFGNDCIKYLAPSLTHMHLDSSIDKDWECIPWEIFPKLPRLSHICLSGDIGTVFLFSDFLPFLVDSIAALPHTITAFVLLAEIVNPPNEKLAPHLEALRAVSDRLVVISHNSAYLGQIPHLHCFSEDHTVESDWGDGMGVDTWEFADMCLAKQNQRQQDQLIQEVDVDSPAGE